ncbi:MAG: hypothetical protein HY657_19575 [Acidobacteria bacterium]|nr:hypothetical protein [Acidobacteriota bacterium]
MLQVNQATLGGAPGEVRNGNGDDVYSEVGDGGGVQWKLEMKESKITIKNPDEILWKRDGNRLVVYVPILDDRKQIRVAWVKNDSGQVRHGAVAVAPEEVSYGKWRRRLFGSGRRRQCRMEGRRQGWQRRAFDSKARAKVDSMGIHGRRQRRRAWQVAG